MVLRMNILLTGDKGVGKTTICSKIIQLMRFRDLNPAGLLTPARYDASGKKIGFDAFDITANEQWALAYIEHAPIGPQMGRYHFDAVALNRAIHTLQEACRNPNDLLLIDEIGPLELDQNAGFASIIGHLPPSTTAHILLVVRPIALNKLQSRLQPLRFQVIQATISNRNSLPKDIISLLWGGKFRLFSP